MMQTPSIDRRQWVGQQVWDGRTLERNDDWIFRLSEKDVSEIRTAIDASRATSKPVGELNRHDFLLPGLGDRLLALRDDVLEGKGFAVLRGLPGSEWTNEDLVRAYWGIGTWFGDPVSQNAKADLLGHVIDKRQERAADTRIYQTNAAQPFHSDSCDIVGLLCLHAAQTGGASSVASSAAIYNTLLANDQKAVETLCSIFHCDRYNEIPEGKLPYYTVRVFNDVCSKLVCCGMDPDIRSGQRLEEVPRLTSDQNRALDLFQSTAKDLSLNMMLERGDVQLVNNHTVVHARGDFEDFEELDRRRYMVRLWLSSPLGRNLPEFMAERWGNIQVGTLRGGIAVPGAVPIAHLDPNQ
jgi:hypothetical protein